MCGSFPGWTGSIAALPSLCNHIPLSILLSWDPAQHICEVWAQQSLRSPGVLGAECTCPSLSFLSIIYCSQLQSFQMLYSSQFPHHTPTFSLLVFFSQYDEHLFTQQLSTANVDIYEPATGGKMWGTLDSSRAPARPRSGILFPSLSIFFALFCGHRWPSEPQPFVLTECWRPYRTEQRIVVRSAQIHHCLLEKPLRRACSTNCGSRSIITQ